MSQQPPKPNLQGILQMALEHTGPINAQENGFSAMDEESKHFIESALKSMTVDVISKFKSSIETLEDSNATFEKKLEALNLVREYVDNIDLANSFGQVGGTDILKRYAQNENTELRVCAVYIIAEMAQNNPFCQRMFLQAGLIPMLVEAFKENEQISSSSLHAVSSIVRNFDEGIIEFLSIGGIKSLLSCLKSPHSRVFIKTCFLIGSMAAHNNDIRDEFVRKMALPELSVHVEVVSGFDVKLETLLFAMAELSKSEVSVPGGGVDRRTQRVLVDLVKQNHNLPQSEEMVEYAELILENSRS